MRLDLRLRLSGMMFVQFFIWGAWYVKAPSYLTRIGFTGDDISWTYSVGPIAAMVSPLFVGIVADRFFAVERVLGVLHLLAGAVMYLATRMMESGATPPAINGALLGHTLCYFPTLALSNSLAMRNLQDPEAQFPSIRVLGTLGWIVANLALDRFGFGASAGMFHLATASSLVLGLYSFTLPHTPPSAKGERVDVKSLLGLDALALLKDRSFAVFMASSFLICIPLAFYYQMAARAVEAGGLTDTATKMSFGQASEVLFMLVMPWFFRRLGVKWMLAVGMAAWVLRYVLFAVGVPAEISWMLISGIVLHGICYDFFFVTGQIYTDQAAPPHMRSQAQGFLVLCTLGLGMLVGAQTAGAIETRCTGAAARHLMEETVTTHAEVERLRARLDGAPDAAAAARVAELAAEEDRLSHASLRAIDWGAIWTFPAAFAGVILVLFILLFRAPARPRPTP